MIKVITYVSTAYTTTSMESMNNALRDLKKHMGYLYSNNPEWACVNALFSMYSEVDTNKDIPQMFLHARTLIDASTRLIIIDTPGHEYSDILIAEVQYAKHVRCPIIKHRLAI